MYILIVSNSIKKSKTRVRGIVDRYSVRVGSDTWTTHMTQHGLQMLHSDLKSVANKHTSVVCYVNNGTYNMKPLWVVGSHKLLCDHQFYTSHWSHEYTNISSGIKTLSLIAAAAGYAHDLGKATKWFQQKLKSPKRVADPIRHEWISKNILQGLRQHNYDWTKACKNITNTEMDDFITDGLTNIPNMIDYVVSTHHGLFDYDLNTNAPLLTKHIRDYIPLKPADFKPAGKIKDPLLHKLQQTENRLAKHKTPSIAMKLSATVVRSMMVMADHSVSTKQQFHKNTSLYANTANDSLNQDLSWHLTHVGRTAARNTINIFNSKQQLPTLSAQSISNILQPSPTKYNWQNNISFDLANNHLVFNIANTGEGKTIGNLKIITSLNKFKNNRVTIALNLKTLTLQTGAEYSSYVKPQHGEICTMIGDNITKQLFDDINKSTEDGDGNALNLSDDITVMDINHNIIPTWITEFTDIHKHKQSYLSAPITISTIDYIINAGDNNKQGHQSLAMLRLASSDLILDEIEEYQANALIAICRIVELTAFFGNNVLCSSATLSPPTHNAIVTAFACGTAARNEMLDISAQTTTSYIHNTIPQSSVPTDSAISHFGTQVVEQLANITYPIRKLANLIDQISTTSIINLHHRHKWRQDDFVLSLGMIRLSFINNVIPLVDELHTISNEYNVIFCTYHSNDTTIQRFFKEYNMDILLSRKDNTNIKHIKHKLITNKENILVFVCSPAEEIGRDHDYDWGIVEPASISSIIQTCGRINRHRQTTISHPNISILNNPLNNNYMISGHETIINNSTTSSHPTHLISNLLPINNGTVAISPALRYNSTFATFDNNAMQHKLQWISTLFNLHNNSNTIISKRWTEKFKLREQNNTVVVNLDVHNNHTINDIIKNNMFVVDSNVRPNTIFILSPSEMINTCHKYNIPPKYGMNVHLTIYSEDTIFTHSELGFFKPHIPYTQR